MRPKLYVDFEMCGGDVLPDEFNLAEFCEELQARAPGVEIVAAIDSALTAYNPIPTLISEEVFDRALADYCCRVEARAGKLAPTGRR